MIYITGDTHGDFIGVKLFCEKFNTSKEDILIILGDAGINYCNDKRDLYVKDRLSQLPITLFCIHGNHEMRPESVGTYKVSSWHGGKVYVESKYPNIIGSDTNEPIIMYITPINIATIPIINPYLLVRLLIREITPIIIKKIPVA